MEQKIQYKPGLVLLTRGDNKFAKTIQIGMGHYWSHAMWVREINEDSVFIQEALGSTKKKVSSSWYKKEHLDELFVNNKLMAFDFGIPFGIEFSIFCADMENQPYDYFGVFEIGFARLLRLFGINPEKFLSLKLFSSLRKNKSFTTTKRVDCSELIARGISRLKLINVLEVLGKDKYELVAPQDIANLYQKLKLIGRL